jgi:2-keto-4-pentenoate hydratase/2-oxohepta-3-ene-1,7-dioic acid hydratase in catechol pathway
MQIIRFLSSGKTYTGQRINDTTANVIEGDILNSYRVTQTQKPIEKLLAPIVPAAILCIGLNYREHAAESNSEIPHHPVLFIKNPNALNDPGAPIELPDNSTQVDYEAELTIVIGKMAKKVKREQAMENVMAEQALRDFEVQMGMVTPETAGVGQTTKELGPATVTKNVEKQAN